VALAGESGVYETIISAPLTTEKRSHPANALATRRVSSFAHRKQRQHPSAEQAVHSLPSRVRSNDPLPPIVDRELDPGFSRLAFTIRPAIRDDPLECEKRRFRRDGFAPRRRTRMETLWDSFGATETRSSPFMELRECDIVFDTLSRTHNAASA